MFPVYDPSYDLYGLWAIVFPMLRVCVRSAFALFVAFLGVFLATRALRHRPLIGLHAVAAGLILWGATDLGAELLWFFTGAVDLGYEAFLTLGPQVVAFFHVVSEAIGTAIDGLCLLLVIVGLSSLAGRLAAAPSAPVSVQPS